MNQRLLLIPVVLWLFAFSRLSAQVEFSLPVINNANNGDIVTVPVTVSNFDSIVAAQFVVQWDSTVLRFLTVLAYNLPNMTNEDFGLDETSGGILRFAWEAPSTVNGHSVNDGSLIFLIKYKVIGEINQGTALSFTELPPTDFEVVKAGVPPLIFDIDDCVLKNGYVAVGFVLSTDWLESANSLPVSVSPNPFTTSTTAFIEMPVKSEVHVVLTDVAGHPVLERRTTLSQGQHGMEIASDRLEENGIYYLIIRTAERSCIRPLVKL
ncbi:MAG: T9SS type A sorting domain-containing protein [Bacteroidetes bacterium]|nr:MAG: T9SS type A sorting domain-containing protein [Bacteroidota bacterium]